MSETSEVLRRAAGLMRERAHALPPNWRHIGERFPMDHYRVVMADGDKPIAGTVLQPDAEYIASWHPAVALAVADWLDLEVLIASDPKNHAEISREALAVARVYLGADQ